MAYGFMDAPHLLNDPRQPEWAGLQQQYGFDPTELWSLDAAFARFLLDQLPAFERLHGPTALLPLRHMAEQTMGHLDSWGGSLEAHCAVLVAHRAALLGLTGPVGDLRLDGQTLASLVCAFLHPRLKRAVALGVYTASVQGSGSCSARAARRQLRRMVRGARAGHGACTHGQRYERNVMLQTFADHFHALWF